MPTVPIAVFSIASAPCGAFYPLLLLIVNQGMGVHKNIGKKMHHNGTYL
ncbi:hypothetical protein [Collimonas fungivorans]